MICVNDGSCDNSIEILNQFQNKDDRIIIIDKMNEGVSAASIVLPYVIDVIKSNYRKWLFCIVLGFLMSVCIETIQYLFALGRTETDDVICNTFGCALGILADTIVEGILINIVPMQYGMDFLKHHVMKL